MTGHKKVFVIGGTGFLGYHAVIEFIRKGWEVTSLGLLPKNPELLQSDLDKLNPLFSTKVKIILCDIEHMTDSELMEMLSGHHAVVYAAGLDDRFTPKRPAYPLFRKYNVEIPRRVLELSQKAGIKRSVTLGSYFTYFSRLWPEMKLGERHPYIRSRLEQEKAVTTIPGLDGIVLELPYIFGSLPISGWRPLWAPLIKYLRSSPVIFYMNGGSACVSAVTVGKAIVAAIEHGEGGKYFPIGQANLNWKEMLSSLAQVDGRKIKIISLPRVIIEIGMWCVQIVHMIQGKEGGLNLRYFSALQTAKTFIDLASSRSLLGYEEGDLLEAFALTVQASKN